MKTYVLHKMSTPGWTLESEYLHYIRWMLEKHVCNHCKWTRKQFDEYLADPANEPDLDMLGVEEENINPYTYTDFFPENYEELTDQEKISLLLNTACGCEFALDEEDNPADLDSGIDT